jgi:1,4-alpha-glucan branching enzyme
MAVMEHPYYASFGYQVSNFFAPSSRFGTPEELKNLINTAHKNGIFVLLDIIHSHAAINSVEGLSEFDGTNYQYFHAGERGYHSAWGTRLFNYGKNEVLHFLLSNIKYWIEEFHFDGFRFDGVTSMLYHNHGLGVSFDNYSKYFSYNTDIESMTYLTLANELIREVNPMAITVAEDMSGMPGMCLPICDGGIGFDYRLAMGVPDHFIKMLTKERDEDWNMDALWHELTTRRPKEKNIGYLESHDQALVGDKTVIFRLADKEMYTCMDKENDSPIIARAMDYHKAFRLICSTLSGEGYLNFMGNEFGHPEWIDFPREGNGDSGKYARRQWSLVDNPCLKYAYLNSFDNAMIKLIKKYDLLKNPPELIKVHNDDKTII